MASKDLDPSLLHDFPGAVLAYAAEAVTKGDIVVVSSKDSGHVIVGKATTTSAQKYSLYVAKHDIPADRYGIVVPWMVLDPFAIARRWAT